MKRIKAACITQTIHFINMDACGSDYSKRKVQEEIKRYKYRMDRERTSLKARKNKNVAPKLFNPRGFFRVKPNTANTTVKSKRFPSSMDIIDFSFGAVLPKSLCALTAC